jgi:3-phosphoshikimate 1-carboxyvinyltransferase
VDFLDLAPVRRAAGELRLPGSKSISNRTLLLAALAEGVTELDELLDSDDTRVMREALATLGVRVEAVGGVEHLRVHGIGRAAGFPVKRAELFLGNAGTAFRPLTAALALADGHSALAGVPRMHERPIGDLVDALREAGARIEYRGREGFPPLSIAPRAGRGPARVRVRGDVSSQFLSALLMALAWSGEGARIEVQGELISKPYVSLTLGLMARFGVEAHREDWRAFEIAAGSRYRSPGKVAVEGDASSASYFLAAGALGGGPVRVRGVGSGSLQGDVRFAEVLEAMGATIAMGEDWIEARRESRGPDGAMAPLAAFDLDLNLIPDAAMTAAVLALFADGPCRIRNIGSWRVKETDRIAAMAAELRKFGARVEEGADFLAVAPPAGFLAAVAGGEPVAVETYDDHRVAMCFSLAAFGPRPVRILEPGCVAKTFPAYFEVLRSLVAEPVIAAPDSGAPVIAIDGPSASGKGTVAARVAAALGFRYLDSGALYRLTTLAAIEAGADLDDEGGLARLARGMDVRFAEGATMLGGREVTEALRTEEVSAATSRVAAWPAVRGALLERQRAFRGPPGLVADGRDMGSIVFPDAALKVFLSASVETRALRRYKQLMEKGMYAKLADVVEELRRRDARDASRAVAPLRHYPDAFFLDTSELTVEQAVQQVLAWWRERASRARRETDRGGKSP